MAPLLLGFISRSEELDLPLLGFDFVPVLLELLLGSDVWISHSLKETNEDKCKLTVWVAFIIHTCFDSHHTCIALCRLRATRLCENSFWMAEKARENLSSPTCFLSSSISSCARFFSVGSEQRQHGGQRRTKV